MLTQEQYEYKTEIQNASLNYFCIYCKKLLKHTVRILVKLDRQYNNYMNMCVGCLATHCNQINIKQYKVCNNMGLIVQELNNKSVQALISCISLVQNKGIQQVQLTTQAEDEQNSVKRQYLELNEKIFSINNLGFKHKQPKYFLPQFQPINKDNNPLNRKHLKALGYNWQRKQFDYLPESVFGLLLGSLQKEQDQDQEQFNTLSNILFREYQKQQQKIHETKEYLVDTMFLLGRKGFKFMSGMPQPLLQLRQKQEQIKEVIHKIHHLINQADMSQKSQSPKKQKKHKKDKKQKKQKKKKKRTQQSRQREEGQYERSRQAKKKKNQQESIPKQEKPQQLKQKIAQPNQTNQPKTIQISKIEKEKKQQNIKNPNIPQQVRETSIKKGRGRPKGSIRKAKILGGKFIGTNLQKDKMQQQIPQQKNQKEKNQIKDEPSQKKLKKKKNKDKQQKSKDEGFEVKFDSD